MERSDSVQVLTRTRAEIVVAEVDCVVITHKRIDRRHSAWICRYRSHAVAAITLKTDR
ncbi:hypothetical protein [Paraburkholderia tropica]|nr:hypothetical protein [Paraburkholderia tropica]MBB2984515.1 hypothetical protein [Paraburkholderia tropica]MBB3003917.1 hypothetical protein [Paraburkholderia tropica]MBB6322761.1 hypothetical protein [Paraburkholderia tropica]QNB15440.1 hypothetical protein G5S35_27970 [Paraburkholderia tropica]